LQIDWNVLGVQNPEFLCLLDLGLLSSSLLSSL